MLQNVPYLVILAKKKKLKHTKHVTGGGPPLPNYNNTDLEVLRIIGDSPVFTGVTTQSASDTPIVITQSDPVTQQDKNLATASIVGNAAEIAKAWNDDIHINIAALSSITDGNNSESVTNEVPGEPFLRKIIPVKHKNNASTASVQT